jgi:hypothetical protein
MAKGFRPMQVAPDLAVAAVQSMLLAASLSHFVLTVVLMCAWCRCVCCGFADVCSACAGCRSVPVSPGWPGRARAGGT